MSSVIVARELGGNPAGLCRSLSFSLYLVQNSHARTLMLCNTSEGEMVASVFLAGRTRSAAGSGLCHHLAEARVI